jgi:hypothetical protein
MSNPSSAQSIDFPSIVVTDSTFADLVPERAILEALPSSVEARQCGTEDETTSLVIDSDMLSYNLSR